MSSNRATGKKLKILTQEYHTSHQLDLLSFVSEQVSEFSSKENKEKRTRTPSVKSLMPPLLPEVTSYRCYGNVDANKKFSNFCLAKSNEFAVESIRRFISDKKSDFGLIFLKAASGLGKTHILHAVCNEMLSSKKTYYFNSPQLMSPSTDSFYMLKAYDIVLIDDIDEIENKTEVQKILCQLMDYAFSGKIKLIIAGAKLPKELNACEERMKAKLSSALIHHIDEMNNDLAFDIVNSRSAELSLDLSDAVKRLVSNQVGFNGYGLESLLYKFKTTYDITGQKITLDMALDEIKEKDKKFAYPSIEFYSLLDTVANAFEVTTEELRSSVRKKEFALARHVAIFFLKEYKGLGIMKIAELFERDHSSVVYAVTRIGKIMEGEGDVKNKIQSCLSLL